MAVEEKFSLAFLRGCGNLNVRATEAMRCGAGRSRGAEFRCSERLTGSRVCGRRKQAFESAWVERSKADKSNNESVPRSARVVDVA